MRSPRYLSSLIRTLIAAGRKPGRRVFSPLALSAHAEPLSISGRAGGSPPDLAESRGGRETAAAPVCPPCPWRREIHLLSTPTQAVDRMWGTTAQGQAVGNRLRMRGRSPDRGRSSRRRHWVLAGSLGCIEARGPRKASPCRASPSAAPREEEASRGMLRSGSGGSRAP
jgi:hypothetical protein